MKQVIRYIILAAIIIGLIYAYLNTPEESEKGINLTPKQLIETIEQKKAENSNQAGTDKEQ